MSRPSLSLALVALLGACTHDSAAVKPGPAVSGDQTIAGTRVVRIFTQGADESSPLVIWLHGRGGRPERFSAFWQQFPGKVEFVLPQAPAAYEGGWSWFDYKPGMTEDQLGDLMTAAEAKLWPLIVEVAHGRKVIVGGFSQGGMLSYLLAERHPDAIRYAFPVAGTLTGNLMPRGHIPTAPIYALHGAADEVISVAFARATVEAFKEDGATIELHVLPGVGHKFNDEIQVDLVAHLRAVVGSP